MHFKSSLEAIYDFSSWFKLLSTFKPVEFSGQCKILSWNYNKWSNAHFTIWNSSNEKETKKGDNRLRSKFLTQFYFMKFLFAKNPYRGIIVKTNKILCGNLYLFVYKFKYDVFSDYGRLKYYIIISPQ